MREKFWPGSDLLAATTELAALLLLLLWLDLDWKLLLNWEECVEEEEDELDIGRTGMGLTILPI